MEKTNTKNTNIKTKSKLSRGAHNTRDKRYQRSENSIRRVVAHALGERRINLRTVEICHSANISSPTFYLHCHDSNAALTNYERDIQNEFRSLIPSKQVHHEITFTILLNFIRHHQKYFSAAVRSRSAWMLQQLLDMLRPVLVSSQITDRTYTVYTGSLSAIIICWGEHEGFASSKIPLYTQKMLQTRLIRI